MTASFYLSMLIKNIDPKKLIPYENNPRINDQAVEAVKASIEEFGFKVPIVIDKDNVIVCGHTRQKAAIQLRMREVPCVVADDLTDEQIRAFRLADNKTAELAEWDFDLLNEEIQNIFEIDMGEFGFDIPDPFEEQEEHERQAEKTQERVENICNLGYGQFDGAGYYDIPRLKPVRSLPEIREWIGFNYVLSDNDPEGKAVHFFIDDYQFERVWNDPERYLEALSRYVCVATPDFSPYGDMPLALQLFNHYRKHWVGAYWQQNGITVIPTIRSSTDIRSYDWYLDGEPENGIVMISSMWTDREDVRIAFEREYNTMYEKLSPCKIFLYGKMVDGLKGNIEVVQSFSQARFSNTTHESGGTNAER